MDAGYSLYFVGYNCLIGVGPISGTNTYRENGEGRNKGTPVLEMDAYPRGWTYISLTFMAYPVGYMFLMPVFGRRGQQLHVSIYIQWDHFK